MERKLNKIQRNLTVYICVLLVMICALTVVHAAKKEDDCVATTSQTELSTQAQSETETTAAEPQSETAV